MGKMVFMWVYTRSAPLTFWFKRNFQINFIKNSPLIFQIKFKSHPFTPNFITHPTNQEKIVIKRKITLFPFTDYKLDIIKQENMSFKSPPYIKYTES